MICSRCAHDNADTAVYCNACGQQISTQPLTESSDVSLWREFIGPRADYYVERFRIFRAAPGERFRLTWHWPAFGVGWLWYLYRKMYFHAAVFLVGGLVPMYLGAGLIGAVIWNCFAAISANFLYYMHVKLNLALIQQRVGADKPKRDALIADVGGIQPYVWWLGIGLMVMAIAYSIMQPTPKP